MISGYISEVFRSVQGEGIYVGRSQVFVRFCGCSLACVYCDSKDASINSPFCVVRGSGGNEGLENPVDSLLLAKTILNLQTQENAFQATLLAAARINNLSLADFL